MDSGSADYTALRGLQTFFEKANLEDPVDLDKLYSHVCQFIGWLRAKGLRSFKYKYSGDLERKLEDCERVECLCEYLKLYSPVGSARGETRFESTTRGMRVALRPLLDDLMALKPAREITWPGAPAPSSPALPSDPPALLFLNVEAFGGRGRDDLIYVVLRAALESKHTWWVIDQADMTRPRGALLQALHDTGYLFDYFGRCAFLKEPFSIDKDVEQLMPCMDEDLKKTLADVVRTFPITIKRPSHCALLGLKESLIAIVRDGLRKELRDVRDRLIVELTRGDVSQEHLRAEIDSVIAAAMERLLSSKC